MHWNNNESSMCVLDSEWEMMKTFYSNKRTWPLLEACDVSGIWNGTEPRLTLALPSACCKEAEAPRSSSFGEQCGKDTNRTSLDFLFHYSQQHTFFKPRLPLAFLILSSIPKLSLLDTRGFHRNWQDGVAWEELFSNSS